MYKACILLFYIYILHSCGWSYRLPWKYKLCSWATPLMSSNKMIWTFGILQQRCLHICFYFLVFPHFLIYCQRGAAAGLNQFGPGTVLYNCCFFNAMHTLTFSILDKPVVTVCDTHRCLLLLCLRKSLDNYNTFTFCCVILSVYCLPVIELHLF